MKKETYTREEIIDAIKNSRQCFYHKDMQAAQSSFIQELCDKLDMEERETYSENEDKN